ncbi:MAG TPA: hypothetical protein VGM82_23345 [Gemmatimonadaceae bacterium]|jgi:hypothetical protein
MTVVWAAVFAVAGLVGLLPLSLLGTFPPYQYGRFGWMLADIFLRWGLGGAAMGFIFATSVVAAERRRSLESLSLRRFTAWGFVAGAAVPLSMSAFAVLSGDTSLANNLRGGIIFGGICGVLGAVLAAASLLAARRARDGRSRRFESYAN